MKLGGTTPSPAHLAAPGETVQHPPHTIEQASKLVAEAHKRLFQAQLAEGVASRDTTAARNNVNRAQKLFDDAVLRLRSEAPNGTDWKSTKGEPDNGE